MTSHLCQLSQPDSTHSASSVAIAGAADDPVPVGFVGTWWLPLPQPEGVGRIAMAGEQLLMGGRPDQTSDLQATSTQSHAQVM